VLIEAATRLFAAAGADGEPSLRVIAREAGIGTLFRRFPNREALVEAVYQDQVRRLTEGADQLLAAFPPAQAMRRWMDLFIEWMATKNGMLDTMRAVINQKQLGSGQTRVELLAAIDKILAAGRAAGDIRAHATSEDVAAGLIGIFTVAPITTSSEQATRLLDIFMNGLSAAPARHR
jgi:AcrR family transcriptional regulator